jgi:hypothetical protein
MTTTQRPSFINRKTDDYSNTSSSKQKALGTEGYELEDHAGKNGVEVDIQDGELERVPTSTDHSGDDFAGKDVPVESAADLVTQIIHLEDDPNENCLTFRSWFLGKRRFTLVRNCFATFAKR